MANRPRFFVAATLAGLALRIFWVLRFPGVVDDSRLYANIAENWMQHGIYGVTNSGAIMPTLSRLPGYPAFLAAMFSLFGVENFRAVLFVQVLFDLATCFLIADLALRLLSERAARVAFLLAALCPFLANYAAAALTETLEIFFTTLALDLAIIGLKSDLATPLRSRLLLWLGCGLSVGAAILLRPDGGILLAAIAGYLSFQILRSLISKQPAIELKVLVLCASLVCLGATAPLIPWTLRNLRTFHRFQPLAPRYANDSDEPLTPGFNRWVKTWAAEYVSTEEIYWNVPGEDIDFTRLPARAYDSEQQREETRQIFTDYNVDHDLSLALDARFLALATRRIQDAPLRYYVWLPCLRIADMWLRPRTELLPSDPRWWQFNDDARWLAVSLIFGVIGVVYVALAAAGLVGRCDIFGIGLFVLFLVLRSAFLGSMENPEPRYTLECYPIVIFLASARFSRAGAPAIPPKN